MTIAGFNDGSNPNSFINRQLNEFTKTFKKGYVSDSERASLLTCKSNEPDLSTPCLKGEKVKECDIKGWDSVILTYSCVKNDNSQNYYYYIYAAQGDRKVEVQSDMYALNIRPE